jgi:hypothetical protein
MRTIILLSALNLTIGSSQCFSNSNSSLAWNKLFCNKVEIKTQNSDLLVLDLVSFEVKKSDLGNRIKWTTVAEVNNDFFTIERTLDGVNYIEVVTINGAGNSVDQHCYSFEDRNYDNAINYYRIKMTDYDGNVQYSELLSVDNRMPIDKEVLVKLNLEGKEVYDDYKGIVIIQYSDGTTKKMIQ